MNKLIPILIIIILILGGILGIKITRVNNQDHSYNYSETNDDVSDYNMEESENNSEETEDKNNDVESQRAKTFAESERELAELLSEEKNEKEKRKVSVPFLNNGITRNDSSTEITILIVIIIIMIIICSLMLVGMWGVFSDAGIPGWMSIIPILNTIQLYRIVGLSGWWILIGCIPTIGALINLILMIVVYYRLAVRYRKSVGYTLGLLFLPFIFLPLLTVRKK